MSNFDGCQLPCVPKFSSGSAEVGGQSTLRRIKRLLAVPWNYHGKKWLKKAYHLSVRWQGTAPQQMKAKELAPAIPFATGDLVRVRSHEEILSTLDPFKELKGCAFLPEMTKFCGTQQRVLKSMQVFLDERDYKVKKVRGVILLDDVICNGTPAFGPCDRCCFLFWREEWLEKISG